MKNSESVSPVKSLPYWLTRSLMVVMGLVLVIAALPKATDMGLFLRQLRDYGFTSDPWILLTLAWALVTVEFVLGAALLADLKPRLTFPLTLLLLLIFLGVDIFAWVTGATEDCGCFGAWFERTPGEAVLETFILLIITLTAWFGLRQSQTRHRLHKTVMLLTGLIAGLALPPIFGIPLSPSSASPWESIETTLIQMNFQDHEQSPFKEGSHVILVFDTECSHCRENFEEMNSLSEVEGIPPITALCTNDEDLRNRFQEEFRPNFPLHPIDEDPFWRLLGDGDIPRVILITDRRVKGVWDVEIPSATDVIEVLGE
jgi:hypothetical protein